MADNCVGGEKNGIPANIVLDCGEAVNRYEGVALGLGWPSVRLRAGGAHILTDHIFELLEILGEHAS